MKEIFKPIPDYLGYQVSNTGKVKSLGRIVSGKNGYPRPIKTRILKPTTNKYGYDMVILRKNFKSNGKLVHQLVAEVFLNHKAFGQLLVVDHIDNNRLNNYLDNLQIITQRENTSKDRKGGSSQYVGVCRCKGKRKWRARIRIMGKQKNLGYFKNEIDAHNAYQSKLKSL